MTIKFNRCAALIGLVLLLGCQRYKPLPAVSKLDLSRFKSFAVQLNSQEIDPQSTKPIRLTPGQSMKLNAKGKVVEEVIFLPTFPKSSGPPPPSVFSTQSSVVTKMAGQPEYTAQFAIRFYDKSKEHGGVEFIPVTADTNGYEFNFEKEFAAPSTSGEYTLQIHTAWFAPFEKPKTPGMLEALTFLVFNQEVIVE